MHFSVSNWFSVRIEHDTFFKQIGTQQGTVLLLEK